MGSNLLYFGDNLEILRRYIKDESVDLIYLDPPFNSHANYNVLFKEKSGTRSAAQIHAFEDTWEWGIDAERTFDELARAGGKVAETLIAFRRFLGTNDMLAYLVMMAPRLVELRRVLRPSGSIYLHCDPSASHFLKVLMDAVFGVRFFRNEIIWQRTSSHNDGLKWMAVHDTILHYARGTKPTWNPTFTAHNRTYVDQFYRYTDEGGRYRLHEIIRTASMGPRPNLAYEYKGYTPQWGWRMVRPKVEALDRDGRIWWSRTGRPYLKRYLAEQKGTPIKSVITDVPPVGAQAAERLGYPTQKPVALLERIVSASSNEGDVVLDPFCGCGTTIAAAQKLGRRWIGIDVTHLAINLMKRRLKPTGCDFKVVGEPTDLSGARALAKQDPYQFQWWALDLVDARPADEKKGADKGIDGRLAFVDDKANPEYKQVVISVKSGHVTALHIRDLRGVVDRENAAIGLFISLEDATGPMKTEAATAGFYQSPLREKGYPRLQLLTVGELLSGTKPDLPPSLDPDATFKRAPKPRRKLKQSKLDV